MPRKLLTKMWTAAHNHNLNNILNLARSTSCERFLDLGCDDGKWSQTVASAARVREIHGVEIIPESAEKARKNGIQVTIGNLDEALPYPDESFDLIHSNQVIEHVADVDNFTSEAFRVLKPGGSFIVSTENGSSWHNIFASVMGWQTFSLSAVSRLKSGIGNPLALHQGHAAFTGKWTHKVIFNHRGLKDFLTTHGFDAVKILGAGYYPLPTWVAKVDPVHAHFITAMATRPLSK